MQLRSPNAQTRREDVSVQAPSSSLRAPFIDQQSADEILGCNPDVCSTVYKRSPIQTPATAVPVCSSQRSTASNVSTRAMVPLPRSCSATSPSSWSERHSAPIRPTRSTTKSFALSISFVTTRITITTSASAAARTSTVDEFVATLETNHATSKAGNLWRVHNTRTGSRSIDELSTSPALDVPHESRTGAPPLRPEQLSDLTLRDVARWSGSPSARSRGSSRPRPQPA